MVAGVMRSEAPLPTGIQLPLPLVKRLAKATGKIEAADVQSDSGRASSDNPDRNPDEAESPQTLEMAEKLNAGVAKTQPHLEFQPTES